VSHAKVNTVLGSISPDELGVTLVHEHIVYGYPGWEGDQTIAPFDREAVESLALELMDQLKALGVQTFVDATTNDGGRCPELLREVSEKSGVNIICSTGYYYEEEGMSAYWKFRSNLGDVRGEVYELFSKEITEGIRDTGIKAGAIKVGTGKGVITSSKTPGSRSSHTPRKARWGPSRPRSSFRPGLTPNGFRSAT
jgi:phosphotriesterase-related protein